MCGAVEQRSSGGISVCKVKTKRSRGEKPPDVWAKSTVREKRRINRILHDVQHPNSSLAHTHEKLPNQHKIRYS